MNSPLRVCQDTLSKNAFNLTKQEALDQHICIKCRQPPTFYSQAGRREYPISGLCEPCFDSSV